MVTTTKHIEGSKETEFLHPQPGNLSRRAY
jgi:hypothetical protein